MYCTSAPGSLALYTCCLTSESTQPNSHRIDHAEATPARSLSLVVPLLFAHLPSAVPEGASRPCIKLIVSPSLTGLTVLQYFRSLNVSLAGRLPFKERKYLKYRQHL
jgi:hypothetical protein